MDFGDLEENEGIQEKLGNFHNSLQNLENLLETTLDSEKYESLNTRDKVNYDLFMAYALNSLYWLYLRTKGLNPNQSDIKNQLNRVKQYMAKAKEAHDRNTIRPKLNQAVAKRDSREVGKLSQQSSNLENLLETTLDSEKYESLNTTDKVNYDLFMAYALNSLYWLYLRTKGLNPNQSDIKNQLNRVKQYMAKAKEAI
ncbi:hypothetical protein FQR65_LT06131 [Abscondita terminalis]|nr:hypothetical protein FQR65_LT06131 [Abscondita terminalis]